MDNKKKFSLISFHQTFPDEESCIRFLEERRWMNGVVSPFDKDSKVYKCKGGRYRCKNTGKYFNVKTGSIFESSKIPLIKWFLAIHFLTNSKKGISAHQLAREIEVTVKTAWLMGHKIRKIFGSDCIFLEGKIEVDETYVGGKNKNRHWNKKVKNAQGRSGKDKTPVFGMIQRNGNVIVKVVPDAKSETLIPEIEKYVQKGSYIYSDEWGAYVKIPPEYSRGVVFHGIGKYVVGEAHTNNIEGFGSHLKRSISGVHHWVSPKHLQLYVDSQAFRHNTRKISEYERFELCLQNIEHRITCKEIINNDS